MPSCFSASMARHMDSATGRILAGNVNVPMTIIGIGQLIGMFCRNGIRRDVGRTADDARTCATVQTRRRVFARPQELPMTDAQGRTLWQKLMVYTAEGTRHEALPIHRALLRRLAHSGTARGATVLRGMWGFYGDHKPHGDKVFQVARRVPVTTIIVGTPESISRSFDIVDELTGRHGLVTSEMVPAVLSLDETQRLGDISLAQHDY